jgi:hypothetical protein
MDLLGAENVDNGALLAAWQSFFLLVPVVHVAFEAAGTLFGGVDEGSLGWLLAAGAERLPAPRAHDIPGRFRRTVLTGDTIDAALTGDTGHGFTGTTSQAGFRGDTALTGAGGFAAGSAQRVAERTARYGTWLPSGRPSPQPAQSAHPESADGARRVWVGLPLRVVRGVDRATVDRRNDLAYDGLLISDRD